jgi:hypothetical protein
MFVKVNKNPSSIARQDGLLQARCGADFCFHFCNGGSVIVGTKYR